jgi:hypothetical protein
LILRFHGRLGAGTEAAVREDAVAENLERVGAKVAWVKTEAGERPTHKGAIARTAKV